jgi:hypothetical protein
MVAFCSIRLLPAALLILLRALALAHDHGHQTPIVADDADWATRHMAGM